MVSKGMEELRRALPDDRPVTGLCIVEETTRCPPGFQVIDKTFDQDTDADLWKDLFFKKPTRYICLSKDETDSNEVVEAISLVGEKDNPPDTHSIIQYTHDTDQKAMKKKQISYKMVPRDKAKVAVTDIIILTKSKRPPAGFTIAGDVSGLIICYKLGAVPVLNQTKSHPLESHSTPYPPVPWNGAGPKGTLSSQISVIDDIPFDINPRFKDLQKLKQLNLPIIPLKTAEDLLNEYFYDFHIERQTQQSSNS